MEKKKEKNQADATSQIQYREESDTVVWYIWTSVPHDLMSSIRGSFGNFVGSFF